MVTNLLTLLQSTGIPVAYGQFEKPQTPPYIIYFRDASDNFAADNKVYFKRGTYLIELYSARRDKVNEAKIEAALDGVEIYWENDHDYLQDEHLHLTRYEIEIEEE